MFEKFSEAIEFYRAGGDVENTHIVLYKEFTDNVNNNENLKKHRDFVEINKFGYGERAFHWMWNILVPELPQNFRFLEIGVYQGQVISLMSLLNRKYNKAGEIVGVTPLTNVDDKYSKHPMLDYEERISLIYGMFDLKANDLTLVKGLSNSPDIIKKVKDNYGDYGFDCVYIDGGHDYETVVNDINVYGSMTRIGGYLVMDDSACKFNIPKGLVSWDWKGLEDVCKAVEDKLENDDRFEHIFSVAHNRIWKRVK